MAEGHSGVRGTVRRLLNSTLASVLAGVLFAALFSAGLFTISQDGHPLSIVDEHIHFDTAVKAMHGEVPFRGSLLGEELVHEWACGVGHEAGPTSVPCGDPKLSSDSIPSGRYSTGYIHYPTYFFLSAAFHPVWAAITGDADLLNSFRAFSALCMSLGVVLGGVFAWLLGLRGIRLLAAMALPVASSMIVVSGVNVNPASTAVLTGVLVAGTGLLWIRRNRGYFWFALSVAASSAVAVTSSLPAGGFLIAMLVVLVGRRFWPSIATGWTPRWWQVMVTAALVLVPVIVWGRVIAARATIANDVLYGFIPPSGKRDIIVGATQELFSLHSPWRETLGIKAQPDAFLAQVLHAVSLGGPTWISVLVFGGLALSLFLAKVRRASTSSPRALTDSMTAAPLPSSTSMTALQLLALGTLLTVVLYPPALRISNWLNFGFDYPIVDRYSSALAPILGLIVILTIRERALSWALGISAMLVAVGTVAGAV